jgi:hypothetical protein
LVTPPGLAEFDSASAMVRALGRFLHGRDFRGLGQSAVLRQLVQFADLVPRHAREQLFAKLGAREGLDPGQMGDVNTSAIADWACRQYPARKYSAVMIGSSNGALMHMAAAARIPCLPQTFLSLMKHRGIHPDDAFEPMEAALKPAGKFLAANPDVQLHHLHDPVQDRLMLNHITYFRFKYRRLPEAYRDFLDNCLQPGGTLIVVDCQQRWPAKRISERHVYQFGAVGGATQSEYFKGSERVRRSLRHHASPFEAWRPPEPDDNSPEAEWGFDQSLTDDVESYARQRGYRVKRLSFAEPETISPAVADFHRQWYRKLGMETNRLLFESFIVVEPYWALRTGTVPFWMTFNTEPSLQAANAYLDDSEAFDELYLTLFAHGSDSVGLPPVEDWQALLDRARHRGKWIGVNPRRYPAHFAAFAKYSAQLRALKPNFPMPDPVPMDQLEDFIDRWREQ